MKDATQNAAVQSAAENLNERQPTSGFHARYSGWAPIIRILQNGKMPNGAQVAAVIEQQGIPGLHPAVVDYLAMAVRQAKPKRGRPRQDTFQDHALTADVISRYEQELERAKETGERAPGRVAIQRVADVFAMSPDWVKDRIYPGRLNRKK
jgi:hypothetical protein